uniref:OCIA domain-containing protein n=1 Tax=Globodera rostochiensis TaxID=31243 RepID=A0A914HX51_GLORO
MDNYPTESGGRSNQGDFPSILSKTIPEFGKLNRQQIIWLFRHLSADEKTEIFRMTGECVQKCAVTYGGTLAAVSIGFLEYMRRHKQKLPITSPRYVIGYPLTVLSSVLFGVSFGFKRSTCGSEFRQHIARQYTKYDAQSGEDSAQMATGSVDSSPLKSYSQLREANRSGRLGQAVKPQQQWLQQQQQKTAPVVDGTGMSDGREDWGNYGLDGLFKPPPEDGGQSSSLPSTPKSF